jgi:hypothetical protein
MAKKKNGTIKDLRTKQVMKVYPDGIKDRENAQFVPSGVTNTLMDVVGMGGVCGDAEFSDDGFVEIMAITKVGIIKLKKLPDDKKIYLQVFGAK